MQTWRSLLFVVVLVSVLVMVLVLVLLRLVLGPRPVFGQMSGLLLLLAVVLVEGEPESLLVVRVCE